MSDWDDTAADWYAERYGDHPSVFAVVAAANLSGGEDVLDIGCGTGSALRALAAGPGRRIGVDPTARMIEIARAQTPEGGIDFHVAAAEALPLDDASADVALAINAVHHWADIGAGLAEAYRVLRPGGRLVIGGERFGPDMVPEGQDYAERLAAAGFVAMAQRSISEGFVMQATKPGDGRDV